MNLFDQLQHKDEPLAVRMRPKRLSDIIGQQHILKKGNILYNLVFSDQICSMIFWGPPGVGKTTLAHVIANETKSAFTCLSATQDGKKELKKVIELAKSHLSFQKQKTILFVDEIHRWNKAQQDALLPYVEDATIILIGATTENPSFEINSALLSRCRVFVLKPLEKQDILEVLNRALSLDVKLKKQNIEISEESKELIATICQGDARTSLTILELALKQAQLKKKNKVSNDDITQAFQQSTVLYDKKGEEFYNIISALHKSMRGSDVNASLYWLSRMIEGGCDPLYIARRLIRFASEDIGLCDNQALVLAVSCYQACHMNGLPECNVNLAHTVIYLAQAKKSNAVYIAYENVKQDVIKYPNEPVPLHIRNAQTKLMKDLGYGKNYKYNPDFDKEVDQTYLPERLKDRTYYE